MTTLTKKIIGDELYLYNAKGELIFKRWISQKRSVVFDVMTYDKGTYVSITDNGFKYNSHRQEF
jgi:hypothetical protein